MVLPTDINLETVVSHTSASPGSVFLWFFKRGEHDLKTRCSIYRKEVIKVFNT